MLAPLGQLGQVLADFDSGRCCGGWRKLAANAFGGFRLEVETLVLCQAALEKDVDHRLGAARSGCISSALSVGGPQRIDVIAGQPQQTDRPRLNGRPPRDERMVKHLIRVMLHGPAP